MDVIDAGFILIRVDGKTIFVFEIRESWLKWEKNDEKKR